ncbi:TPA: antitermination protein [Raoultella ornithinolytica]
MTRRTSFSGSAAGRRRERRAALQNSETSSVEVMHRPTLSRAQLQAKGTHHTPGSAEEATPIKFVAQDVDWNCEEYKRQIERAAIVYSNEFGHKPLDGGMCLPEVALFAAGHRKSKQVTAR